MYIIWKHTYENPKLKFIFMFYRQSKFIDQMMGVAHIELEFLL